jgi:hypothetical protein
VTRDLFDPNFGTLDLIVFLTLRSLGLIAEPLNAPAGEMDAVCERNALRLYEHFQGARIQGIKAVRSATNIGLREAKDAFEQIVETYVGSERSYLDAARVAIDSGNYETAIYQLRKAQEARGF